jgi:hypothetical protein
MMKKSNLSSTGNSGIPPTEILKLHQKGRLILIDTMYEEYSKFYNLQKVIRSRLIDTNKKLKDFFKSEREQITLKKNQNISCHSMIIIDEPELELISSPFDKIFDNQNSVNFIEIKNSQTIAKGVYVYPTKENYRTEENLEIKHMVKIDNFAKFEEVLEKIRNDLEEAYIDYPHNKEESEIIKNGNFLIWILTKSLLKILFKEDCPFFSANQIIFQLIKTLSEILRKSHFYVYKLSSEFFGNFTKKIKLEKCKNLTPVISKYRFLYCKICYIYFCKRHLYTLYHYENIDGLKIYRKELINQSGNLIYSKKEKEKSSYLPTEASIGSLFTCHHFRDCRLNHEQNSGKFNNFSMNNNCREYDYNDVLQVQQNSQSSDISDIDYYMAIFSHIDNKFDFYLLINLVNNNSPILTNSCFINKFIFCNKFYKCHYIDKIIKILREEKCSVNIINAYLNSENNNQSNNNNFSNFNLISNSNKELKRFKFPSIESEKLKENYQPDILLKKQNKNKVTKPKLIDPSYTLPCNHAGVCTRETCDCIERRGVCEKFCSCAGSCNLQYIGCNCKDDCSMHEYDASCPCAYNQRECDPDICYCKSNVSVMNKEDFTKISERQLLCEDMINNSV